MQITMYNTIVPRPYNSGATSSEINPIISYEVARKSLSMVISLTINKVKKKFPIIITLYTSALVYNCVYSVMYTISYITLIETDTTIHVFRKCNLQIHSFFI